MAKILRIALIFGNALALGGAPAFSAGGEGKRAEAAALYQMARQAFEKGDRSKALTTLNEVIRLDPLWSAPFYNRGNLLLQDGEVERALADYNSAIKLASPPVAAHHVSRATAYVVRQEFEKAIGDLQKAIALEPEVHSFHRELGNCYCYIGKWQEAIKEASVALKHSPNDYNSLVTRGLARCHSDDFDGGMADLEKAIRLDPKNIDAYCVRGAALFSSSKFDEALQDFDRVLSSKPQNFVESLRFVNCYWTRGIIRRDKGDSDAALADFAEALRLNPKQADVRLDRGQLYGEKKEYAKALADFNEHIRMYPTDPRGYEMRSLAHIALGDPASAAVDQRKADDLRKAARKGVRTQ